MAFLVALSLLSLTAMIGADVWQLTRQREREEELMYIGAQYTAAIERYYLSSPAGQPRTLPNRLEDLLQDNRFPTPIRHLRRIYVDPMTGDSDWVTVRVGRGLAVHSRSEAQALKQAGFTSSQAALEGKKTYAEWLFAYTPPLQTRNNVTGPIRSAPRPDGKSSRLPVRP